MLRQLVLWASHAPWEMTRFLYRLYADGFVMFHINPMALRVGDLSNRPVLWSDSFRHGHKPEEQYRPVHHMAHASVIRLALQQGDMKTCPSLASVASLTAECCTKLTVHAGSLPLNPPEVKMKSKWTLFTCLIQGPAFLHIIYQYPMKSEVWKKSQTNDSSFWLSALLEIILPLGQIAKNIATITDSVAFLKSFIVKNE